MIRQRYQTGSLFKRGKRRKVWIGRWREDVIGDDGTRDRIQRSKVLGLVSEHPTRRDALRLLEDELRAVNSGASRPQSMMGFRSYVEGEWSRLIHPTLKASTQYSYNVVLRKHLVPYFEKHRLCEMTRQGIQEFVNGKFKAGAAWQTVRNLWVVLSSVLESAVEYGHLGVNPVRGVRFPSPPAPKVVPLLTPASVEKLLVQLEEPCKTMVLVAIHTGVRIGELLALRWRAVDFSNGTLRICESVFRGQFQAPKTRSSIRTIPIGPQLSRILQAHLRGFRNAGADDLVFPWKGGRPHSAPYLLQEVLQPAAQAAGVGHVTWHQFRHLHTSLLHNQGTPMKVAQQQLGHSSMETTSKIYTHAVPGAQREAIEGLERLLFPNVPKFCEAESSGGFVN